MTRVALSLLTATLVVLAFAHDEHGHAAAQNRFPTFPLSVAIASAAGIPVVDGAWLQERVQHANEIFAPAGVAFEIAETRTLDERYFAMRSREDRHALATVTRAGYINVFVVDSLADIDASGLRMGVHWRGRRPAGIHYTIVAKTAWPTTLAHELGHFFGNPHSPTVNNIMSYSRNGIVPPFFDEGQLRRIRDHATRFRRTHEIALAAEN